MFDVERIKEQGGKNFAEAWMTTADLIPRGTVVKLEGKGKSHPLRDMVQRSREILLGLGFDEIENLTILPDHDVSRQYGPEARVILDRVFYLAALPRPEIGLKRKRIAEAEGIVEKLQVEKLQSIFRRYKKGDIEADDLVEELVLGLDITDYQAIELLDRVFPEVKTLHPVPTNKTLRSHMTATWFHTLQAMQDTSHFPLALFSVGPRYRNEQREDAHHLRVHNSASVVIMHPEMSLEAGREIAQDILRQYGFSEFKFKTNPATSKYYAPGLEQEVFVKHGDEWLEVADIGMYSPVALANFDIKYPVFNVGFGIERMAMVLHHIDDVRTFAFPQFSIAEFSDEDIAQSFSYINSPGTARGRKIARAIESAARKHKNEIAPCEFVAWDDGAIQVVIMEKEKGKRLVGPAGFNEICVTDGGIYSDVVPSGVYTGISYMRALAMGAAASIENDPDVIYQTKEVKHLSDLNLQIPKSILEYIEGQHKEIDIRGAVFVTIKSQSLRGAAPTSER